MKSRTKRTRSPRSADEPPAHRAPGSRRRRGPDRRSASDARRIAELEAEVDELRGKMAALEAVVGVDLHDSDEVRALRAAQHRNGGGSGFGLLHVQHESGHRLSKEVLAAVRTETGCLAMTALERVDRTVLARWTMPHGVVPSLVAEHVVAPFTEPDWVVSGPGAPGTVVLGVKKVRDVASVEWRDPSVRHTPAGQKALMKFASSAASPGDVVALSKLLDYDDDHDDELLPSTEFCNNFFCKLAPHATTAEAVRDLCDQFSPNGPSDDDVVDLDTVQRFFVALVPGITDEQALRAVAFAVHKIVCLRDRDHLPFSDAFYRGFVLPLARRASSSAMADPVCRIFTMTFSKSWNLTEDLPRILTKFCQIFKSNLIGQHIWSLTSMIACIACNTATVGLVSDVVGTVVLPLVTSIHHESTAAELLSALTAMVAYRSLKDDASSQQDLEEAMQTLRHVKNPW